MCLTIHTICWISKAGKDAESISESKAMLEDRNYVKVGFIWFHSFSIGTTWSVENILYCFQEMLNGFERWDNSPFQVLK